MKIALLIVLAACSDTTTRATPSPAVVELYKTRCTACHGDTGRGDGPALPKLPVKPPNFTDSTWQSGATDDELRKAILDGGPSVGKNPAMPPARPFVDGKPELVDELVALVRGFTAK